MGVIELTWGLRLGLGLQSSDRENTALQIIRTYKALGLGFRPAAYCLHVPCDLLQVTVA